jgi:hypothetical protein
VSASEWQGALERMPGFLAVIAAILVAIFAAAAGAKWLTRQIDAAGRRALALRFAGLAVHERPEPGDVMLVCFTMHPLAETTHRLWLPLEEAQLLLQRLLWFNLTWGCLSLMAPLVPVWSALNYFLQRRFLLAQRNAEALPAFASPPASQEANPYAAPQAISRVREPRSLRPPVCRLAAASCAALALLVATFAVFAPQGWGVAIPGLLAFGALLFMAWTLLRSASARPSNP